MRQKSIMENMAILVRFENGYIDFEEFIKNGTREFRRVWEYLVITDGRYDDSKEDRVLAFNYAHKKGTPFNTEKISEILRQLNHWLEVFIIYKKSESDALGHQMKAEIARHHGEFEEMEEEMDIALEKALSDEETKRFGVESAVHFDRYFYKSASKKQPDQKGEKGIALSQEEKEELEAKKNAELEENLDRGVEALDIYYSIRKLKYFIEKLTLRRGGDKEISPELEADIRSLLAKLPEEKIPLVAIQEQAINYFLAPSRKRYEAFKSMYLEKVDLLKYNKKYLLKSLINAVVVLPNTDEKSRLEFIFLYRLGIDKKILLEDGEIEPIFFENIVYMAEALEKHELIDDAIDVLGNFIRNEKERKMNILMAEVYATVLKDNYIESLKLLDELDKIHGLPYTFILRKYVLRFKCIYEQCTDKQEAYNYLKSRENSYKRMLKRYLKRELITEPAKKNYVNYFHFLCKITNQKNPKPSKKELFDIFINYDGNIQESKWLEKKIAEL